MAYDPYGGQTPEQQLTAGSIARDLISPSTLLMPYTMDPRSYSNTKGIWTPFQTKGSEWKKAFSSFRDKKYGPYVGGLSKPGKINMLRGVKSVGGLVNPFGDYRILTNNAGEIKRLSNLKSKIASSKSTILGRAAFVEQDFAFATTKLGELQTTNYKGFSKSRLKTHSGLIEGVKNELEVHTSYLSDLKNRTASLSKREKIVGKSLTRRNLFKWGIRGAKAGTLIGAASFAWDIASLVAPPLAQAAMGAINNMATEYQNRFMPEMGGQLQLSYLSQGAATERQRAVQAISKSYINGRSAFGSEGSMMHS